MLTMVSIKQGLGIERSTVFAHVRTVCMSFYGSFCDIQYSASPLDVDQQRIPIKREILVNRQKGASNGSCGDTNLGLMKLWQVQTLGVVVAKRRIGHPQQVSSAVVGKSASQNDRIEI
jgi:hypothetical protein